MSQPQENTEHSFSWESGSQHLQTPLTSLVIAQLQLSQVSEAAQQRLTFLQLEVPPTAPKGGALRGGLCPLWLQGHLSQ